jgi:hypothetical protein
MRDIHEGTSTAHQALVAATESADGHKHLCLGKATSCCTTQAATQQSLRQLLAGWLQPRTRQWYSQVYHVWQLGPGVGQICSQGALSREGWDHRCGMCSAYMHHAMATYAARPEQAAQEHAQLSTSPFAAARLADQLLAGGELAQGTCVATPALLDVLADSSQAYHGRYNHTLKNITSLQANGMMSRPFITPLA